MTPDQLARRFLAKAGQPWDNLPSGIDPSDIDAEAVQHFMRLAQDCLPSLRADDPPERLLENLELLRDGVLTNAGVLLFTQPPSVFSRQPRCILDGFRGGMCGTIGR